jgi:hypothetical protein
MASFVEDKQSKCPECLELTKRKLGGYQNKRFVYSLFEHQSSMTPKDVERSMLLGERIQTVDDPKTFTYDEVCAFTGLKKDEMSQILSSLRGTGIVIDNKEESSIGLTGYTTKYLTETKLHIITSP